MRLTIKDRTFTVQEATITGGIVDPYWRATYGPEYAERLMWSIDIQCEGEVYDGENWEPRLYHEQLQFNVGSWKELEGAAYSWNDPAGPNGEMEGGLYVFEHEPLTQGSLMIGRRSGSLFQLRWSGQCDIWWDEEYGGGLPFLLECEAQFQGIQVNASARDNDDTVRERLARYIRLDGLKQQPILHSEHKYQSGVGMALSWFVPGEA